MLGAMGKASERERMRMRCTATNTDEDREKTSIYRVEKVLLRSQVHDVVSGYSRTRAGDGAQSSGRSKVQGDGGAQKVDPLGREHSGV